MISFISLFAGIGGIDLGLERAGCRCVCQVEIDPFCRRVLAKHWPEVQRHEDVTRFDATGYRGSIDLVAGGFPCQDISTAGKGAGLEGERSGLWFEMLRVVREVRPRWVFAENVPALRTRGADRVFADLEAEGYSCRSFVVGAWAVGAPHRRDRVWIVADSARGRDDQGGRVPVRPRGQDEASGHASRSGSGELADSERLECQQRSEPVQVRRRSDEAEQVGMGGIGGPMADATPLRRSCEGDEFRRLASDSGERGGEGSVADPRRSGLAGRRERGVGSEPEVAVPACGDGDLGMADAHDPTSTPELVSGRPGREASIACGPGRWPARPGERQWDWEAPRLVELEVGGSVDGLPAGLVRTRRRANRDALKAYGNAVVPQVVEAVWRAVMDADR